MTKLIVYVTFEKEEQAQKIAKTLIQKRLAACANIFRPHQSIYWWEGKAETSVESAAIFKTTEQNYDKLEAAIKELHPYDVPCIVAWPIEKGHLPFLKWIEDETKQK